MRKISKKIIVLLLVAIVAIAGGIYIGLSETEDVSASTLKAGEWVFLDVSEYNSVDWTALNAIIKMLYVSTTGEQNIIMTQYSDDLYCAKIPEDIGGNGQFKFYRSAPSGSGSNGTDGWNWWPSDRWLTLNGSYNLYKITDWQGGGVQETWKTLSSTDKVLEAGDYVYFDISAQTGWASDAVVRLSYIDQDGKTQYQEMRVSSDNSSIYYAKIPTTIGSDGKFRFDRAQSESSTSALNTVPFNAWLRLDAVNTNVFELITYSTTSTGRWGYNRYIEGNNAGKIVYFFNMNGTAIEGLKAEFSVSSDLSIDTKPVDMIDESGIIPGLYKVTIPEGENYDIVKFIGSSGNLTEDEKVMNGTYVPDTINTYYYNVTEKQTPADNVSFWGEYPTNSSSITGKKLYIDALDFNTDTVTIKVGNGTPVTCTKDEDDDSVYTYIIPSDSGATRQTIITVEAGGSSYHFLWSDPNKNKVNISSDIAKVDDTYVFNRQIMYFMNMGSTSLNSVKAKFYVSSSSDENIKTMTQVSGITGLYKVTIPVDASYDMVQFLSSSNENLGDAQRISSYSSTGNNTFYYNITEKNNGNINIWGKYPTANGSIAGRKIYFDKAKFPVSSGDITLQIGSSKPVTLGIDKLDRNIFSYTIPSGASATQQTVITVEQSGTKYHFLWTNTSNNVVSANSSNTDIMGVNSIYTAPALSAGDWLFLDATAAPTWTKGEGAETVIKLAYSYGNGTEYVEMKPYGDYMYRVQIPEAITETTPFWFERYKIGGEHWWNSAPKENTNENNHKPSNYLVLTSTELGKTNTYRIKNASFDSEWAGWTDYNVAGKAIYFMNMSNSLLEDLSAVFSLSSSPQTTKTEIMIPVSDKPGLYKVIVPDDADYDRVKFITSTDSITDEQDILEGSYKPDENNTYYYNITEKGNGENISIWGACPTSKKSIASGKLYFDRDLFAVSANKTIKIQIGTGTPVVLTVDEEDDTSYSYTIPSNSNATQITVITVIMDNNKYHFLWTNMYRECIEYISDSNDILGVVSDYVVKLPEKRYIYFDATLSKLAYTGTYDQGDISIPHSNSSDSNPPKIFCKIWKSSNENEYKDNIVLTKLEVKTIGNNTWSDVYFVEIDSEYDMIKFYSEGCLNSTNADCTKTIEITNTIVNPCFYADTSDAAGYGTSNRSGYWGDVYEIRDVQSGKEKDVVKVPAAEFARDENILYVNTTLYDYFSDFELNGLKRSEYPGVDSVHTHRIYQQFRQFNQALSSYYEDNDAKSPLYWGNVQHYPNKKDVQDFYEIAGTLNLYGYNTSDYDSPMSKKFRYENNSMFGIKGDTLENSGGATVGLVSDSLSNGSLMLKADTTDNTTFLAPFFDEEFLNGNNSKNTVLGEVYKNVSFPFVKKNIEVSTSDGKTSTVQYWYYNSSNANNLNLSNSKLQLRKYADNDEKYFLTKVDEEVKGEGSSYTNYFPFNTAAQSGNMSKLNYGFGQKLEFNFRLTADGTVTAADGSKVPIEFAFDGDDDVWVFIDGVLILDIGGAHSQVEGTIDFYNRKGTVNTYKPLSSGTKLSTNYEIEFPSDWTKKNGFYDKEHTLTMYYMERGLFESNMLIRFNFPDEDKLSVQKEVNTDKVNDLFKDLFKGNAQFTFNIKNQATHYGEKLAQVGNGADSKIFNQTFKDEVEPADKSNKFEYRDETTKQSDVVLWYASPDDTEGKFVEERWGIISPSKEEGHGATADMSGRNAYLQFSIYYPHSDTATLAPMRIEVEDKNHNKIGGSIQGKIYGNSSIKSNEWNTLCIDLRKFTGYEKMDFSNILNVKFAYDFAKEIYLDEFIFKPAVSATKLEGFTTEQYQMPDYGSANSGMLENAVNALYTTVTDNGTISAELVDEKGRFVLVDGQKITFSNQFRKGSYIYLEEEIDSSLFDVRWEIYENGNKVTSSIAPADSSKVEYGYLLLDKYSNSNTISDGRIEKYDNRTYSDGVTTNLSIGNIGYPTTGKAKLDSTTYTDRTIVFRSYDFPDSVAVSIDLLIKEINTVKTGSLTIQKEKAEDSQSLNDEIFTIQIEFTNVAGKGLESKPIIHEVKLKAGESTTIEGIPAGTIYTIKEIIDDSKDIKLDSITQKLDANNEKIGNDLVLITGTTMAQGQVLEDTDVSTATCFIFTNSLTPTIKLNLNKDWETSSGAEVTDGLPERIWVQIQRKAEEDTMFEVVNVPESIKGCIALEPTYDGWIKQIVGLEKYKDNDTSKPYTYKVVEMRQLTEDTFEEVKATFWYDGSEYKVEYTDEIVLSYDNSTKEYSFNITNIILDLFDFSFTKVTGSENNLTTILGAEFILYEYKGQPSLNTYEDIMNAIDEISDNSELWVKHELKDEDNNSIYSKTDLSRNSVYYLVETRVPTGMQSPNGCWKIKFVTDSTIEGELVYNNVKITPIPKASANMPAIGYYGTETDGIEGWFITNLKQWDIPETGGIGLTYPYMAGICLMLIAVVWGGALYYRDRRQKRT